MLDRNLYLQDRMKEPQTVNIIDPFSSPNFFEKTTDYLKQNNILHYGVFLLL